MRKLTMIEHISLDGVIQHSADENNFPYGNWSGPYRTAEGLAAMLELYGERFDLLLGRRTYDLWSSFWPKAPSSPMADRLQAAKKHVVTHRPASLEWGPFESVGSDVKDGTLGIKAQKGPHVIVSGSSTITSILLEHGLVDTLVLAVNPVLLGEGKRLFAQGTPPRSFELVNSSVLPSGIVLNSYQCDGPLKNM
ncbi:MAG: dihydrofolate reductase family protein [Bdellovibrionota bacterium]